MSARHLVAEFGGDWHGTYGLVPGPGHSSRDRSLKVYEYRGEIRVHSFADQDWRECRDFLGLGRAWRSGEPEAEPAVAKPSARIWDLLRSATTPDLVPDVLDYLQSRNLWPLPAECALRAHACAPYFADGGLVGRFPALLAEVADIRGELVTLQVTYLKDGRKLQDHPPRKMLSGTTGRRGCAVRLVPARPVLGLAEGIETALAAERILDLPVWATLSAARLAKFEPPAGVERLVVAADCDRAGYQAAWDLRDNMLPMEVPVELRLPMGGDFAEDVI